MFPVLGWLVALLLHGLHNAGAVLAEPTGGMSVLVFTAVDWMGVLGMLILILYSVRREKRWFEELDQEIANGVEFRPEVGLVEVPPIDQVLPALAQIRCHRQTIAAHEPQMQTGSKLIWSAHAPQRRGHR